MFSICCDLPQGTGMHGGTVRGRNARHCLCSAKILQVLPNSSPSRFRSFDLHWLVVFLNKLVMVQSFAWHDDPWWSQLTSPCSTAQDSCSHAGLLASAVLYKKPHFFGVPKYALRVLKVSFLDIAFLAIYPCLLDITPLQISVQAENEWEHQLFHTARVQDGARSLVVFTCEHYISGFRPIWIVKCKLIIKSGWWFQTVVSMIYGIILPNWLCFFKMFKTTNQKCLAYNPPFAAQIMLL